MTTKTSAAAAPPVPIIATCPHCMRAFPLVLGEPEPRDDLMAMEPEAVLRLGALELGGYEKVREHVPLAVATLAKIASGVPVLQVSMSLALSHMPALRGALRRAREAKAKP